jgi:hypothetical protein
MTITIDAWDAVSFAGVLVLLAGLAWLHPALGLVGLGCGLIGLGILGAKRWASSQASSNDDGR